MTTNTFICPSRDFNGEMFAMGKNTAILPKGTPLTESEMQCMRELARGRPDVPFTLKQLFGLYWDDVVARTRFGLRVQAAVMNGSFSDFCCHPHGRGTTRFYRHMPPAPTK